MYNHIYVKLCLTLLLKEYMAKTAREKDQDFQAVFQKAISPRSECCALVLTQSCAPGMVPELIVMPEL